MHAISNCNTQQNQMTKVFLCHVLLADVKVAATSLKLEVRLHALTLVNQVRTNTWSGINSKVILRSSDWLMHSEAGYFA